MGICYKHCLERDKEKEIVKDKVGIRQSKLSASYNQNNLKQTIYIDNIMNSLIFKNPYKEMIKDKGQNITLEEFKNEIPSEYLIEEEKDPYNLNNYSNNEELIKENPIKDNNIIYYGNWNKNLKISGSGEMLILNSEKIYSIGIWKNGYFNKGRIYFKDGRIYEGEVKNNTFNGNGKMKYKNGDIYEGNFENGKKKRKW